MATPYSDKKKLEVVTTYLALGKLPMVESVTGVPRETIRVWKLQPWWKEMVNQIQTESNQELDTKLSKIIDRSLDAVNERIEGGEFILDSKTGTVKRIPVRLKDVHRVAVDLLDKRDLIRDKPAKEKQAEVQIDVLKKLAGQFAEWVKVNMRPKGEVIDVTPAETLYAIQEQSPSGLLSHSQEGTGETGSERSGVGQGEQGQEPPGKTVG